MSSDAEKMRDILETFSLMETLISQKRVLNIDVLPYDLSTLMKEFRAEKDTYNQVGNNAMAMFYSDQEKQEFEEFLRKKGVSFDSIGDSTNDQGETTDTYTTSPVAKKKTNRYGI
jgi:hypothetical protein